MSLEQHINELCTQLVENTKAVLALTVAMGADTPTPKQPGTTVTPVVGGAQGVTVSQPVPAAESPDLDVNGMPWDARIHSGATDEQGNHKKTGKSVWQKRKGVPPADFKRIESEIMASIAGGAAIPSTGDERTDTSSQVGLPEGAVIRPPSVLVLPIPADINSSTYQDCVNITQVFAEIHGIDAMQYHLNAWGMSELSQLPPASYAQYVQYMVDQDVALAGT